MTRTIAVALLAVATTAHAVVYLYAAPEHVVDAAWPLHARFHVLQALLWAVGFDLVLLALVFGPFRRGHRWALWVLGGAWPFVHAGYFIALAGIRGGGPPERSADVIMGGVMFVYAAGWALGWLVARTEPPRS